MLVFDCRHRKYLREKSAKYTINKIEEGENEINVLSYVCKWFDRSIGISIGFTFYMGFMYVCCFWLYKIRRRIDEKIMNQNLKQFQSREKEQ